MQCRSGSGASPEGQCTSEGLADLQGVRRFPAIRRASAVCGREGGATTGVQNGPAAAALGSASGAQQRHVSLAERHAASGSGTEERQGRQRRSAATAALASDSGARQRHVALASGTWRRSSGSGVARIFTLAVSQTVYKLIYM